MVTECCYSLRAYACRGGRDDSGRASDTVDKSTGATIEEGSTGEEGVGAAAAAPNPNKMHGGQETSFSFFLAGADDGGCSTMSWGVLAGNQNWRQGHPPGQRWTPSASLAPC